MNDSSLLYSSSDDHELIFFRSLKNEMHELNHRKIIGIVQVVLGALANSLPTPEFGEVKMKLPSTLQLILNTCPQSPDRLPAIHLDELVENVCRTQTPRGALITNEIDALKYVLIVIKNLKIIFDKIGLRVFPYCMISEYQQAVQEEVI